MVATYVCVRNAADKRSPLHRFSFLRTKQSWSNLPFPDCSSWKIYSWGLDRWNQISKELGKILTICSSFVMICFQLVRSTWPGTVTTSAWCNKGLELARISAQ